MKYGKIKNGRLVYFSGNNIVVGNERVFNPSEETLATAGYFPVVDIAEDGTDELITDEESGKSHIAHYIGAPVAPEDEPDTSTYEEIVERKVRARYSISAEFAVLRQRDSKPEEFAEYFAYCEQCKSEARAIIEERNTPAPEEAEPEATAEEETTEPENTDEV